MNKLKIHNTPTPPPAKLSVSKLVKKIDFNGQATMQFIHYIKVDPSPHPPFCLFVVAFSLSFLGNRTL